MSSRLNFLSSKTSIVERAARAGGVGQRDRGARNFIATVIVVVIVGSITVGFAWAERQYEYPTLFDSWENAYGVYDCQTDSWLEPFSSRENPNGIRSRGDGVIYIEPNDETVAGDSAQLGVFLDNVGVTLTDDELTLPESTTIREQDAMCNGEPAALQVLRWSAPPLGWGDLSADVEPDEVLTDRLATTRFLRDQEALAIVFAPLGASVPPPPSIANLKPLFNGDGT